MMYEELVGTLRKRAMDLPEKFSRNAVNIDLLMKVAGAIDKLQEDSVPIDDMEMILSEVAKPRWIPVTERLPEKDIEVLVFAEGKIEGFFGDTVIAISKRYDFRIFTGSEGVEMWQSPWQYFLTDYEITHWMPLPSAPEPPKEET